MSDWPVIPPGDGEGGDHPEGTSIAARTVNLLLPVVLLHSGQVVQVQITMMERDARAIDNMDPRQAVAMGDFFATIKDSLGEFLRQNG